MVGRFSIWAFILLLLAYLFPYALQGQTNTNIGGIVNIYREVTEIIPDSCQVRVTDADSFAVGDMVLLIQMQGASINESQTSSTFGDIIDTSSAGKYEINYICAINANTITLTLGLNNTYSVTGKVQLIKIPQYENATVTSTLTAKNWDGTTGGVLAIDIENTLILNANIDVSGKGFRGGLAEDNINLSICNYSDQYYNSGNPRGALKGEGIALFTLNKEAGKGKQANGGGGGNHHNAGGGGGGNFGTGGIGGSKQGSCSGTNPGFGGVSISTNYNNRLFFGGGGGAGHDNNGQGSSGSNGGGLLIINSDNIEGNNNFIRSNGNNSSFSLSDGAGGGGAGGTIFIISNSFGSSSLNIETIGGTGGNSSRWDTYCMGPGGGGGGGVLLLSSNIIPSNINTNFSGGSNGYVDLSTTASCAGTTGGAQSGTNGGYLLSIDLFQGPNTCTGCIIPLPVTWLTFQAKAISKKVHLEWSVANEENLDHYVVERSANGNDFKHIISVSLQKTSSNTKTYQAIDEVPMPGYNYYRIKNVDKDGKYGFSVVQLVNFRPLIEKIHLYPNPASENSEVTIEMDATDNGQATIYIMDILGKVVLDQKLELQTGYNSSSISLPDLPAGIYPVQIHTNEKVYQLKLVIQ